MNFFQGKLTRVDGGLTVDTAAFQVPVPTSHLAAYQRMEGKPIVFGIRPEDIHDPAFAPPGLSPAVIDAQVDVTELMGNEVFVYLAVDSQPFVGRVDPRTSYHMGDRVQVALNMEHMHLFEVEGDQAAIR